MSSPPAYPCLWQAAGLPIPHPRSPCTQAQGFTAVELMVVIAILAVLASLAAPSFRPLIERWRVRQVVEGLQSTLHYARSEAVRRGGGISIQKLPQNTNGCKLAQNKADWDCGWAIVANNQEIRRIDTPADITVTRTTSGPNADRIQVDRWGGMDGVTALGFTIAPLPDGISSPATKGVCVAAGGRIKVVDQVQVPC